MKFWLVFIIITWYLLVVVVGSAVEDDDDLFSSSFDDSLMLAKNCHEDFQGKCKCGYEMYGDPLNLKYVTNCTNAGFTDASMLKKMSAKTEVLIFNGNRVPDLPLNIFGKNETFDYLEVIDFSHNHIQTMKGKTFHNVNDVKKLVLDDNDLYIVSKDHHPRVFSNFENLEVLSLRNAFTENVENYEQHLYYIFIESDLRNLRKLNLAQNEMKVRYAEMFCSMQKLKSLRLSDNYISNVNFTLSCLPRLKELDLSNNRIARLSPVAIKQLDNFDGLTLNLTSNPFDCDCRLVQSGTYYFIVHRSNGIRIPDRTYFKCATGQPKENVGRYIFQANLRSCQRISKGAEERKTTPKHHSTAGVVVLSLVFSLVCAFLVGAAYVHRASLSVMVVNILGRLKSKGRYSSLDVQEEEKEMQV